MLSINISENITEFCREFGSINSRLERLCCLSALKLQKTARTQQLCILTLRKNLTVSQKKKKLVQILEIRSANEKLLKLLTYL